MNELINLVIYEIADFTSVLVIAFIFNVIFVIYELTKVLEIKYKEIQNMDNEKPIFMDSDDFDYISNYKWKIQLYKFYIWIGRLQIISIFNSIFSLGLLIILGFNPNLSFNFLSIVFLLFILFSPIVLITYILTIGMKKYKINCMYEAVSEICKENEKKLKIDELDDLKYKYLLHIKFIESIQLPYLTLFKIKEKDLLNYVELIRETNESVNKV